MSISSRYCGYDCAHVVGESVEDDVDDLHDSQPFLPNTPSDEGYCAWRMEPMVVARNRRILRLRMGSLSIRGLLRDKDNQSRAIDREERL